MSITNNIWLIAGRARAGKDTIANILGNIMNKQGHNTNITHFADKLKLLSYTVLKEFDNDVFNKKSFNENKDRYNSFLKTKNRVFLQHLGTHSREILGDDIWVNTVYISKGINIIADHRFENEKYILKQLYPEYNVKSIRVFRDIIDNDVNLSNHKSEKIDFKCDINVYNNYSLERLEEVIENIIIHKLFMK